jgi:Predicted enzyme related to lactoylglutathione lyase
MKFCWVTLKVKNMEESLKFYQEIVGLTLDKRFQAGLGVEIAFLGDGDTQVELIYDKNNNEVNMGTDISLGFEVKSVDDTLASLKEKGIDIHSGPIQPNPHVRYFFIKIQWD